MAKTVALIAVIGVMLAVAVQAHPGRKMQQLSQQLGSRATAAQSDTAAKINAAIDNNVHVKPSQTPKNMVTTASVHTPRPAPGSVTAAVSSAPKTSQGAAQAAGRATAAQSATEAKIGEAASGAKPTKPAANQAPKPTTMIATTSKTMQGGAEASGRSTAGQAATAAAINTAASGAKPTKP
jgi:cobalamin biosynthesis Mg chelatase CobN